MPTTLAAAARAAIGRRSEIDSLSGMKPELVSKVAFVVRTPRHL